MHELSIALSLVDLAQEEAEQPGRPRLTPSISGSARWPGVVKEALLSSYELACAETPLEGSRLVIEEVPVVVFCPELRGPAPS